LSRCQAALQRAIARLKVAEHASTNR
jgi:hypothetical protein